MRFHYGYFILVPNGHVVPFGDDWGPTTTAYRVGGSLGVRNEKEGTVVGIEVGPVAKSIGFDVVVLVAEHDPGATIVWAPSPDLLREAIRALTTKPELPPTIQTIWEQKNVRMVAIWNQLFGRPLRETFHEFLVEVPLKHIVRNTHETHFWRGMVQDREPET